jgi:transcriptional regulator with XRE-family HTH domain
MAKSVFTEPYGLLLRLLVAARRDAGMTQQTLAARLGKPQSYVSKVERGERRIDVIEFLALARGLGADPYAILAELEPTLPTGA